MRYVIKKTECSKFVQNPKEEPMLEEVMKSAEAISSGEGPDAAARYLSVYRQKACDALGEDFSKIGELLIVVTAQVRFLSEARFFDKAAGVAEWFLHLVHHLEEMLSASDYRALKLTWRESFSQFFYRYARALRELGRHTDMRLAMRTSLDLTAETPSAVAMAVALYVPLLEVSEVEGESGREWFVKRCAEFLAVLDFTGHHGEASRACLDEFQYMLRDSGHSSEALDVLSRIRAEFPDDPIVSVYVGLARRCAEAPRRERME